jgi:hypothetical protein
MPLSVTKSGAVPYRSTPGASGSDAHRLVAVDEADGRCAVAHGSVRRYARGAGALSWAHLEG